jgi:hypothetical protein
VGEKDVYLESLRGLPGEVDYDRVRELVNEAHEAYLAEEMASIKNILFSG